MNTTKDGMIDLTDDHDETDIRRSASPVEVQISRIDPVKVDDIPKSILTTLNRKQMEAERLARRARYVFASCIYSKIVYSAKKYSLTSIILWISAMRLLVPRDEK